MATVWMQRSRGRIHRTWDEWESLFYCFQGPPHWNWWDPISFAPNTTYPQEF